MDMIGRADLRHRGDPDEVDLLRRLLDDGLLDRVPGRGGVACWALPPTMRDEMAREVAPGVRLASRLRVLLARADDDEDGLDEAFGQIERAIRTGC